MEAAVPVEAAVEKEMPEAAVVAKGEKSDDVGVGFLAAPGRLTDN